ncbi:phage protein Gp27 family protein [Kiloniella litopenaei]|uniref:phage protein Gp27 family protein n=1 Tax=Kiloniella litopenaei TaxID=1549748 RepID=UPI003BA9853D
MARRSTIEKLPTDLREEINGFLMAKGRSVDEFTEYLQELLNPLGIDISRSAAHRHMSKHDIIAQRMRESRELATTFAKQLDEDALKGDQGQFLIQALQTLINQNMMAKLSSEDDSETSTKELMILARALKDVIGSKKLNDEAMRKVREEVFEATKAEAARTAEKVATQAGLSAETVLSFKESLLGIKVDAAPDNG